MGQVDAALAGAERRTSGAAMRRMGWRISDAAEHVYRGTIYRAMSTTHSVWSSLMKSALLGTERQPSVELAKDGALGALLQQLEAADAEATLLGAAGIVSLYERAGRLAP